MRVGFALAVAVTFAVAVGSRESYAQTVDLVDHNGFEACWTKAVTKTAFLAAIQQTIDGQQFCVPEQSSGGIVACYNPACQGGATGCPITAHAGAFAGDFATGAFSATGTADDVVVPVNYGAGTCTITFSSIALGYAPSYHVTNDGDNGDYMAYLTQSAVSLTSFNHVETGLCTTIYAALSATIVAQAEQSASAGFGTLLAPTVGESVCPLTP